MSETVLELTDDETTAFRLAESDDPVKRLVGFSRLGTLGLATVYAVGGRFLHLSLNEKGKARRDALPGTKQSSVVGRMSGD